MASPVQVFNRSDGFTEVYVGTEHDDFPRNQIRAVLRFHRLNDGWSMHFSDGMFRVSPEAIHACLGVALREMAAQRDGGERESE